MNDTGTMEEVAKAVRDGIREMKEREIKGEVDIDFICPICGSELYTHIYHDVIVDGKIPRNHCECAGCSVVFQNPVAFSKRRRE